MRTFIRRIDGIIIDLSRVSPAILSKQFSVSVVDRILSFICDNPDASIIEVFEV